MGIQGLLVALKPYTVSGNIRDYAGSAIAVDTSSWLHKSVYSIADHYVEQCVERAPNHPDQRCIQVAAKYVTNRCQEWFVSAGISQIYLVMDGKRCPLKAVTNQDRDSRRAEQLAAARRYRHQGRHDLMFEKYKACIKVTDALAHAVVRQVQRTLGAERIHIVWSPYEADAQIVQLIRDHRAVAAVTEDSDVLVYQAATQTAFPILYKLDRHTGDCDVLSMDWLLNPDYVKKTKPAATSAEAAEATDDRNGTTNNNNPSQNKNEQKQLQSILDIFVARQRRCPGWGARLFVQACVLTGCDYAPRQLPGVGLVTAFKYVRTAGLTGSLAALQKVFGQILWSLLPHKVRRSVTVEFLKTFEVLLAQSESVFYYHPVVDTQNNQVMHLTDLPLTTFASGGGGDDVTPPTKHAPSLDRFDGQIDFLGLLVANRHSSSDIIPPQVLQQQSNFFRKRGDHKIRNVHTTSTIHHRENVRTNPYPHRQHRQPEPTVESSHGSSLTSPSTGSSNHDVAEVNDDYTDSKHQPQASQDNHRPQRRKPLQPCQANIVVSNPYKKLTPAETYAKRHAEGGMALVHRIVTAPLPARGSQKKRKDRESADPEKQHKTTRSSLQRYVHHRDDVRFVKRNFPKDGSRATLPTPPAAKVVIPTQRRARTFLRPRHSHSDHSKQPAAGEEDDNDDTDWTTQPLSSNLDSGRQPTNESPKLLAHDMHLAGEGKHSRRDWEQRVEKDPDPRDSPADQNDLDRECNDANFRGMRESAPVQCHGRSYRHSKILRFTLGSGDALDPDSTPFQPADCQRASSIQTDGDDTEEGEDDSDEILLSPPPEQTTTIGFHYEQEAGETASPFHRLASEDMFDPERFHDPVLPRSPQYDDNQECTKSAYFDPSRDTSLLHDNPLCRRVTLDASRAAQDTASCTKSHELLRFAFYDQASPELRQPENSVVDLCDDDEEKDSEHFTVKPKTGPLKSRWNRPSSASQSPPKKKKSVLTHFLERNRKRQNLGTRNKPLLSFQIGSGTRWTNAGPRQSTLLTHFGVDRPGMSTREENIRL